MTTKREIFSLVSMLGVEPRLEHISDRIKLQKLVYLAEVFGVDAGFTFTWYVHGPYSPDLTKVAFEEVSGRSSGITESQTNIKKMQKLKEFLGQDIESSDKLELVASLHYVLAIAKKTGSSEKEALDLFYDEKPHFPEKQVKEYLPKVKKLLKEYSI